jgi:chromosome segregation ATPase
MLAPRTMLNPWLVQELQSSNKGLVDAVVTARSRLEEVLRENDALRDDLAASVQRAAALKDSAKPLYGSAKSATSGILDQQRNAELQEIADLSAKEAKALREEVSLLLRESQELRDSCHERDDAIMAQMSQHKAVLQSLSQAQDTIRALDRDRQIAEQEVQKLAARFSDVQREHAQCEATCSQLHADVNRKTEQIKDYRAAIEELSAQANVRAVPFNVNVDLFCLRTQFLAARNGSASHQNSRRHDSVP